MSFHFAGHYSLKQAKLSIDAPVYFLTAFILLAVPIPYLAQWCGAVFSHEIGHILAVKLLGGNIYGIRVQCGGAVIYSNKLEYPKSVVCMFAGPLCGMLPVFLLSKFPIMGIISIALTIYNLLPFLPLDGGRIMNILLEHNPQWSIFVCCTKAFVAILLFAVLIMFRFGLLMIPLSLYLKEIFLAKEDKKGYNSATIEAR